MSAVSHHSLFADCCGRNTRDVTINIKTGKDITGVNLLFEDPYAYGISGDFRRLPRSVPTEEDIPLNANPFSLINTKMNF